MNKTEGGGSLEERIKFLTIKENVKNGEITVEHIGTDDMVVDPLTKGLCPWTMHRLKVNVWF